MSSGDVLSLLLIDILAMFVLFEFSLSFLVNRLPEKVHIAEQFWYVFWAGVVEKYETFLCSMHLIYKSYSFWRN